VQEEAVASVLCGETGLYSASVFEEALIEFAGDAGVGVPVVLPRM
jgi:hypothetical protein